MKSNKDDYFIRRFKGKYKLEQNNPTNRKKLKEIKALGYQGGKLLDIGCAYGFFLKEAEQQGFKTYGIDTSKEAISQAKSHSDAKLICGDIASKKLRIRNIDVCVALNTLEHIDNYVKSLKNIRGVLRNKGLLLIYVPTNKRWMSDYTHINYFTVDSLKFVLEKIGFKVISIGEEGGRFQIPLALIRLLLKGDTNFNYVPRSTGSFITCYALKRK